MDSNYKLQVRLGSAEFSAEGPEETVKQAFEKFLKAVSSSPDRSLIEASPAEKESPLAQVLKAGQPIFDKVFFREGDVVSLRLLPPDSANRNAEAAILLLYGFQTLLQLSEVPITKLNAGLRKSGLSFERLDSFFGTHKHLYLRGGTRSGARYTLNNQGVAQAEEWLKAWFN